MNVYLTVCVQRPPYRIAGKEELIVSGKICKPGVHFKIIYSADSE
jgi:hypothetical protein